MATWRARESSCPRPSVPAPDQAHRVLQRPAGPTRLLEEMKQGNLERECREEACLLQEARGGLEDKEKTVRPEARAGPVKRGRRWVLE